MQFNQLNIIEPILRSLAQEGYHTPTPIQAQAIPIILEKKDLLGSAQTGTGKTAAFAIPILQLLAEDRHFDRKRKIKSLIVTPTRELAIQIDDSFRAYGRFTGLKTTVIFGGVNQNKQTAALRYGVDILIATPGRLLDLMDQNHVSLKDVEIFVLDEADRMLDMGFIHDIKRILHELPAERQSLFFSATMPPVIVNLANTILRDPIKVEIKPVASTTDLIEQYVMFVDKVNKQALLREVLSDKKIASALVFTRTKFGADAVVRMLEHNNISAEAIHSNKSQNYRQRALKNFKSGRTRVLVATDIAARGIDVDDLEYVINYEVTNEPETYVHRIGRTGRAGANGTAFSFCDASEKSYIRDIEKLIGKQITIIPDHPYPLVDNSAEASKKPDIGRRSGGGQRRPSSGQPRRPSSGGPRRSSSGERRGPSSGEQRRPASGERRGPSSGGPRRPASGERRGPSHSGQPKREPKETLKPTITGAPASSPQKKNKKKWDKKPRRAMRGRRD
jgi:ATP-dependent RNA helicase RhlE